MSGLRNISAEATIGRHESNARLRLLKTAFQGAGALFEICLMCMNSDLVANDKLTRRADKRNLLFCVALATLGMLAAWPFADLSYADDFAFADVALKLAKTGHFLYNSWEAPMLLMHAYWGALFIRLFGFSFECVRFSTIPFSLGAVVFCYILVRRAGLKPSHAFLVTLLLGLSPLFVPLSVTYMTDVPCLFFTLSSLYLLSRAAEECARSTGFALLGLGAVLGFLGGTSRQVVWLVPLVVLPYMAWVKRRQTKFALASCVVWILVGCSVAALMAWFSQQPYVVQPLSVIHQVELAMKRPLSEANIIARVALMLLFVVLPAALPVVLCAAIEIPKGSRVHQVLVSAPLVALFVAVVVHPSLASIPWVNSTLNWEGINGSAPLSGRPIVLTMPIRAVAAISVYVSAFLLIGACVPILRRARRVSRFLSKPADGQFTLAAMTVFSVAYFALLVLRGTEVDIFDRYLLPIIPWVATVLLLKLESENGRAEQLQRRIMPVAWAVLAVLALYAVASTQDFWSLARTRVTATKRLESAGVLRKAIDAGMEYNGWTQLLTTGQMNFRWVKNPPGELPTPVRFYSRGCASLSARISANAGDGLERVRFRVLLFAPSTIPQAGKY
jgi:4-amino-4-deoxy-L-arabinose transferase-like glycosyltransferase